MGIMNLLNKKDADSEKYMEIEYEPEPATIKGKLMIDIDKIKTFEDSLRIQEKLRNGKIIFAKIKDLKNRDIGELKRTIARIRKTCIALDGDIAGVDNDWIILTPSAAKVHRS